MSPEALAEIPLLVPCSFWGSSCSLLAAGSLWSLHLQSHCLLLFSQCLSLCVLLKGHLSLGLGPTQIVQDDLYHKLLNCICEDNFAIFTGFRV